MSNDPLPPPPPPPPAGPPGTVPGAVPGPTPGAPGLGPLGRRRSIGLVILLTIVTLGIWALVWSFQTGRDLKDHTRQGLGGGIYVLITFLLAPATMFLLANEVEQMYRAQHREPPITTIWGLWFLLPVIGNLIWYVRIQGAINDYWTAMGATDSPGL